MDIEKLYEHRFAEEHRRRNEVWKTLCSSFFQRFIGPEAAVLDVGAGYCEFINNILCGKKYALDLNKDIHKFAASDVSVLVAPAYDLSFLDAESIDVVFASNFLEHLRTKEDVLRTLQEAFRILKPSGDLLILQPNIRYACKEYWDFFDHHIPLSDRSIAEALALSGFRVKLSLPRFLPYTTKSRLPQSSFFVKAYLRLPIAWRIFGKQMFVVANKA